MRHFRKKTVLPIAAVIVFLVLAEVIYQVAKPKLETTYTLSLDDLIHANGETNGESGGTPNMIRPCMTFSFIVNSIYKPCGTGFVLAAAKRKFLCTPGNSSYCLMGTLVFRYNYNSACQVYSNTSSGAVDTIYCSIMYD